MRRWDQLYGRLPLFVLRSLYSRLPLFVLLSLVEEVVVVQGLLLLRSLR